LRTWWVNGHIEGECGTWWENRERNQMVKWWWERWHGGGTGEIEEKVLGRMLYDKEGQVTGNGGSVREMVGEWNRTEWS